MTAVGLAFFIWTTGTFCSEVIAQFRRWVPPAGICWATISRQEKMKSGENFLSE